MTHYDYGFRIYNPAIAKFLSVDPLTADYPFYTPYQFAGNTPIQFIDLDGLEEAEPGKPGNGGKTIIQVVGKSMGDFKKALYDFDRSLDLKYDSSPNHKIETGFVGKNLTTQGRSVGDSPFIGTVDGHIDVTVLTFRSFSQGLVNVTADGLVQMIDIAANAVKTAEIISVKEEKVFYEVPDRPLGRGASKSDRKQNETLPNNEYTTTGKSQGPDFGIYKNGKPIFIRENDKVILNEQE
jgi:hypothetical protein